MKVGRQRAGLMLCCSWCLFSAVVLETSEKSNLNVTGWSQLCSGELRERSRQPLGTTGVKEEC